MLMSTFCYSSGIFDAGDKFISLEVLEAESSHSMVQVVGRSEGKHHMKGGSMLGVHERGRVRGSERRVG